MKHMMEMSESEIAYWDAFLQDINKNQAGKKSTPNMPRVGRRR